jgi:hypothetical protein
MISMNKILFPALLILASLATPIWAIEPGMSSVRSEVKLQREQLQEARELAETNREENREAKCDLIETRINTRLNQTEQNRDRHYNIFQGVRTRVGALITQFEHRGCDVAGLKTNLTKFDALIADFAAAFREFTASMQATREYRCGESEGKFAQAAQESRGKSLALRTASQAVHAFFKNTIQPELMQQAKICQPSPKPSASPISKGEQ